MFIDMDARTLDRPSLCSGFSRLTFLFSEEVMMKKVDLGGGIREVRGEREVVDRT